MSRAETQRCGDDAENDLSIGLFSARSAALRGDAQMELSRIDEALLVAALFRGGTPDQSCWNANSDQVVTLSLFYTGDLSRAECVERFLRRGYMGRIYNDQGDVSQPIADRYRALIGLIRRLPELIEGAGNLELPADPSFTACRLTEAGRRTALQKMPSFPRKPEFPDWPSDWGRSLTFNKSNSSGARTAELSNVKLRPLSGGGTRGEGRNRGNPVPHFPTPPGRVPASQLVHGQDASNARYGWSRPRRRGKGMVSRTWRRPQIQAMVRSIPRPKPPWGIEP
jgi:hypothetical protein